MRFLFLKRLSVFAGLIWLLSPAQAVASNYNNRSFSKWNTYITNNYKVIYPAGADSIAYRFARNFEDNWINVSLSSGFLPNQQHAGKFPIVLMNKYPLTMGVVMSLPSVSYMSLYANPSNMITPISRDYLFAVHENRHMSQFEACLSGDWEWFHWAFGDQLANWVLTAYSNMGLLEGDAVVMETALGKTGRGRSGEFLKYYRMAFDNGDYRNWQRWRYGSQKRFTPDYYKWGYITVAGIRTHSGYYYGESFMGIYLDRLTNAFSFRSFAKSVSIATGGNISDMWADVTRDFEKIWKEDDSKRGPFQNLEPLVKDDSKYYVEYKEPIQAQNGDIIAIRSGMAETPAIIRITGQGDIRTLARLSSPDVQMTYSKYTDRIYWTEYKTDPSFNSEASNVLRSLSLSGSGKKSDLTQNGIILSPMVSNDGKELAVAEYLEDATYRIILMDVENGNEVKSVNVDADLSVIDLAFSADDRFVVFSAIDRDGMGLFITDFERVQRLEQTAPFTIRDMKSEDGQILFTSDKNGTNEIYSYRLVPASGDNMPRQGVVIQLTNTRYGVSFPFIKDGEICFSALTPQGELLSRATEPFSKEVLYDAHCSYPIADALTVQEMKLQANNRAVYEPLIKEGKYSKAGNFLRIHSWYPFFINQGFFSTTPTGFPYETATAGLTAFLDNNLGTLDGALGLSIHSDPFTQGTKDDPAPNKVGFHGKLNYNGMVPKFSFTFDVGDRRSVRMVSGTYNDSIVYVSAQHPSKGTAVSGSAMVYLPWNLSYDGWYRTFVIGAGMAASTDELAAGSRTVFKNPDGTYDSSDSFTENFFDAVRFVGTAAFDITLPVPESRITPRWGVGGGLYYTKTPHLDTWCGELYGYLPGLSKVDGIRLHFAGQYKVYSAYTDVKDSWGFGVMDVRPRGFTSIDTAPILLNSNTSARLSFDYTTPLFPMDFAIGQVAYLRNMELNPFADYTMCSTETGMKDLYSVGVNVVFRFEKLIFNQTYRMGVQFAHNGGSMPYRTDNTKSNSVLFVANYSF